MVTNCTPLDTGNAHQRKEQYRLWQGALTDFRSVLPIAYGFGS